VARLVGAPPGYVGYDDGGQLTDAVRRRNYSCILFDEIEKAHPEVFNMLLQIFDDGHLSDAKGRKVDFRNTILVMTSNIGSDLIKQGSGIGFTLKADEAQTAQQEYKRMSAKVTEEVRKFFRPEFLNRLDAQVVFHPLNKEHILSIVDLMLNEVRKSLLEKGLSLEVTKAAKEWLSDKGYDQQFGARPLRRAIQNHLEDPMAEQYLLGKYLPGDTITVDVSDDQLVLHGNTVTTSS
jgi:ATP-dependent Clp protease ATP-binding subunit ClpC